VTSSNRLHFIIFTEYKADIICLQELDKKHYDNYYQPVLSRYGYESSILLKKHQKVPPNVVAEDEESGRVSVVYYSFSLLSVGILHLKQQAVYNLTQVL